MFTFLSQSWMDQETIFYDLMLAWYGNRDEWRRLSTFAPKHTWQWIYLLNWFTYLAGYSDINWTLNMETVSKYMRQPKIMESGMALPGVWEGRQLAEALQWWDKLRFYVPSAKGAEGRRLGVQRGKQESEACTTFQKSATFWVPLRFDERPTLVPVFANQKKILRGFSLLWKK